MHASLQRLNHVAIAVPDLDAACRHYKSCFSCKISPPESLEAHGVRIAWVDVPGCRIELMEPLGDDSPLRSFLQKHPQGGLHHLCFDVPNLASALKELQQIPLRHTPQRIGAHGAPVSFLHPKEMCGTLIELQEHESSVDNYSVDRTPL